MTRINLVPVTELTGPHLVAEYRELPRVFGLVKLAQTKGLKPKDIKAPENYVMGTGHVKFFYTKLSFLRDRQEKLIAEMLRRGYKPSQTSTTELVEGIDLVWLNDWEPDDAALRINRARIFERLNK